MARYISSHQQQVVTTNERIVWETRLAVKPCTGGTGYEWEDTEQYTEEWVSQSTVNEGGRYTEDWICTVAIGSLKKERQGSSQPSGADSSKCAVITKDTRSNGSTCQPGYKSRAHLCVPKFRGKPE